MKMKTSPTNLESLVKPEVRCQYFVVYKRESVKFKYLLNYFIFAGVIIFFLIFTIVFCFYLLKQLIIT